jgi:hypothetical protein
MRGIRAFLYRFLVRLLHFIEQVFGGGGTTNSITTESPADGATNVPLPLTASGTATPNMMVNGFVLQNGQATFADTMTRSATDGSWTLTWNNANMANNTTYTLKTFIVSTTDPASCITGFTTAP